MNKIFSLCLSLGILGSWACSEKKPSQPALPNTPEAVAELWVKSFYGNDFEKALQLSTANTKEMIDTLRKDLVKDAEVIAFKIYGMSCEVLGDSATCEYIYEEEGIQDEEYISLRLLAGQWLVDEQIPEEEEISEEEMELLILEELNKLMEDIEE